MIVDHSRGLHKCIANRTPHKIETAFLQVLGHCIRFGRAGLVIFQRVDFVLDGLSFREGPNIRIEASEFLLSVQEFACILNGCAYLRPVADNTFIVHQSSEIILGIFGNLFRIKRMKGLLEVFPLVDNRIPTQSGLERIQDQELEKFLIIVQGNAPLGVVIVNHQRIIIHPGAAFLFRHIQFPPV